MPTLNENIEISIDGNAYEAYNFLDICLKQELLKPNEFRFTMQRKEVFEGEDIANFSTPKDLLGANVRLSVSTVRFDREAKPQQESLVFEGIIFSVNTYRQDMTSQQRMDVLAYSPDYLLMDNAHCYSYEQADLSTIVSDTLAPYKLSAKINPTFTLPIPYTVQYNETNYQFITRLAQRYGEWFYYNGKELVFGKIKKKGSVTLYPRVDVLNYQYNTHLQHDKIIHGHHNYLEYANPVKGSADIQGGLLQSILGFHELTDVAKKKSKSLFTKDTFQQLQCSRPEENGGDELDISLKAQSMGAKSQLTVCSGTTVRADIQVGSCIQIKDFYDKENNQLGYYDRDELVICQLTHTVDVNGNYQNTFTAIPAKSKYPPYFHSDVFPVTETQRAKVIDNNDSEHLGRIRVQFLWQEMQDASLITPWIRITQPHGGNDKGFYFIPEIGEEVMVGFEMGNAEKPYAIGTLYHGKQRPGGNWPDDTNDIKAIRTRNGHTIEIHDEGNDGFIRIYDNEKENYILTLSTDQKLIKLQSTGNIELYAENNIILEAKNNINLKAGVDMNRDAGENISETAGKDISTRAGEDMSINVGNDMSTSVTNNETLNVGSNQTIEIGANKDETISEKYQLTAQNIREEASDKFLLYSQTHEQKADGSMKLDGGKQIDIKATLVKIN